MKNIKYTLWLISFCISFLIFTVSCKKEKLDNTEDIIGNYSLINENSKEYFIADITGIDGMKKLNYQDSDCQYTLSKNYCPSFPWSFLKVKKSDTEEINIFFFTSNIQVKDYILASTPVTEDFVEIKWYNGDISSHARKLETQQFNITEIFQIEDKYYAKGEFYLDFRIMDPADPNSDNDYCVMTNGIFQFKLD